MTTQDLQTILEIQLPDDYLAFRGDDVNTATTIEFRFDDWTFWPLEKCATRTQELRKSKAIPEVAFAFADNDNEEVLFYSDPDKTTTAIKHLDSDGDLSFYAFSFCEITLYPVTQRLIDEIDDDNWEQQDFSALEQCPGSLVDYANALMTSEYDEYFSVDRNEFALSIYLRAAAHHHPEAAHEIANYYYYQDEVDVEAVIKWRKKAIACGNTEDIYELADFIIDEQPEQIEEAIALLESLLTNRWYQERALLKLSRIYMRGTGGQQDYQKGIALVNKCVDLGNDNALADLAFYYFKGVGVTKDVKKAHQMLTQAEENALSKTGVSVYKDFIDILEKELKR
ncbi:tetratricopeptide repeat protein [Lewinella sp. 4G2]|uniref:tetratricopeptide repeat protein n=1 Tax=Lewinella sp. 4G2 TaxID=1803372 RepID=UPI0007B4ADB1|nr:SEL1-like repeat protein [Lewinella sp. 4G2]OAV45156.1 hypothetical protein A3850_011935 [Lewinella sp. 4G2]